MDKREKAEGDERSFVRPRREGILTARGVFIGELIMRIG